MNKRTAQLLYFPLIILGTWPLLTTLAYSAEYPEIRDIRIGTTFAEVSKTHGLECLAPEDIPIRPQNKLYEYLECTLDRQLKIVQFNTSSVELIFFDKKLIYVKAQIDWKPGEKPSRRSSDNDKLHEDVQMLREGLSAKYLVQDREWSCHYRRRGPYCSAYTWSIPTGKVELYYTLAGRLDALSIRLYGLEHDAIKSARIDHEIRINDAVRLNLQREEEEEAKRRASKTAQQL